MRFGYLNLPKFLQFCAMSLLQAFKQHIQHPSVMLQGETLLLALSAGLDSVVLGHLLYRSGITFGVAHCHFGLRGADADADAAFARDLAQTWSVPFFVRHFNTAEVAANEKISIQMAARQLRYAWFETLREEQGFSLIASAHHLNDAVETALFNWSRGTGVRGLGGISVRQGKLLRPLLFASRQEIADYAQTEGLQWREDSSNAEDYYARNFIRQHIVPQFLELNPSFLQTANRSMERLRESAQHQQFLLDTFLGSTPFLVDKYRVAQHPALQRLLFEWLHSYGFTEEQARQMADLRDQTGQEWHSEPGWRVLNERTRWILSPPNTNNVFTQQVEADDLMLRLPNGQQLFLMKVDPATPFPDGKWCVHLDAEAVIFPLVLRHWQPGDTFQPIGMHGQHQKLQDFFTNEKLSQLEKEQVLLLVNGDNAIIWVMGYRMDNRFKITDTTTKALKINCVSTH
jgi:tRNA(Ile)-lysidine synthase